MSLLDIFIATGVFIAYVDNLESLALFLFILCAITLLRMSMRISHFINILEKIEDEKHIGGKRNGNE